MCGLSWVSSATNLGGIFIVLDVTALEYKILLSNYKYERDRALGNRLVISSEEATGQAILFNFSNAVKRSQATKSWHGSGYELRAVRLKSQTTIAYL